MTKKIVSILFLLFSFPYCAYNFCMAPSQTAEMEDITGSQNTGSSDEDSDVENSDAETIASLIQMLREGRNVHLVLNNPTIANQILQQHVQQRLAEEPNPIHDALNEVCQAIVTNAGVSFGQRAVEMVTANSFFEKINRHVVTDTKLALKLEELTTTVGLISAKRAQGQSDILASLKKQLSDSLADNEEEGKAVSLEETDEKESSEEQESIDYFLQLMSSQKSLHENPLSQEEIDELSSNLNSVLHHISSTLQNY